MFDYRGLFIIHDTPARGQLFINSVTLYAYDATDVTNNDKYATVLESFVITSSLQIVQVNMEKISGLDPLVLAIKWGITSKKASNMICHTT